MCTLGSGRQNKESEPDPLTEVDPSPGKSNLLKAERALVNQQEHVGVLDAGYSWELRVEEIDGDVLTNYFV